MIKQLRNHELILPKLNEDERELVTMKELGIGFPVLINPGRIEKEVVNLNPNLGGATEPRRGAPPGGLGAEGADLAERNSVTLLRFDFKVQFAWKPMTPTEREQKKREEEQKRLEEQQQQSQGDDQGMGGQGTGEPAGGMPPT